jgi:hypothetical protein
MVNQHKGHTAKEKEDDNHPIKTGAVVIQKKHRSLKELIHES